jgi:hypothetical protein
MKFETFLIIPHFSACQPESIGILMVKISRTHEKLLLGVFYHENFSLALLGWNFDVFLFSPS